MTDICIHHNGNGPFTVPFAPRGAEYKFMPGVKNIIDSDVWSDLSSPGGPLFPFLRQFKVTSKPGAGDNSHRVTVATLPPKVEAKPAKRVDAEKQDLIAKQKAEIDRLRAQLAASAAMAAEAQSGAPEADDEADDEPEAASADLPDPSSLSVSKLAKAIEGMGAADLAALIEAEKAGKNRASALDLLGDALSKAGPED